MLSKWLTARPKNIQPAAPRKHVVPYHESSEESEEDCFVSCIKDKSKGKVIVKSENNSNDAPSKKEEKPETALEPVMGEWQSGNEHEGPKIKKKKALKKSLMRMDLEENQKNPAYIPRNRNLRSRNDRVPRKKNRGKDEGHWKHDRFQEEEQAPKSREELIATYGFDIRACKKFPPKNGLSHPETVQNKKRRTSKRLQSSSSALPKKAYKELQDLHNRLSPSKNTYSVPSGYKEEQPDKFQQNESPSPNYMSEEYKCYQAQCTEQPSEGSSDQRQSKTGSEGTGSRSKKAYSKRPVVKMSYARAQGS